MKSAPLYFTLDINLVCDPITIETDRKILSEPISNAFDYLMKAISEKFYAEKCIDAIVYAFDNLKEDYDEYKMGILAETYSFFLYALKNDHGFGEYINLCDYTQKNGNKIYDTSCFLDFPDVIKKETIGGHVREVIYLYSGCTSGSG